MLPLTAVGARLWQASGEGARHSQTRGDEPSSEIIPNRFLASARPIWEQHGCRNRLVADVRDALVLFLDRAG